MEAILKFDLSDPDDREDHARCVKATNMALVLWQLYFNEKKSLENKLGEKEYNKYEALDMVFERLRELLDEHDVNIDRLIS